ncbi:MAG: hypothetical protein RJQ04_14210 [Longimicrobiales bacterium]
MADEIRGLWIGERLSTFERLCIRSFQAHGHPFRLFTYSDVKGVPEGTLVEDGNAILDETVLRRFQAPGASLAHFADWFRWELLRQRGGWWVDMDLVCVAPFRFDSEVVFGYQHPGGPAIGALRFPAGHPLTVEMVDRSANPTRLREGDSWRKKARKLYLRLTGDGHSKMRWAEGGGPLGFAEALRDVGGAEFGLPFTVFYPVHNQHWPHLFDETLEHDSDFYHDTVAVHLWNEIFRRHSPKGHDATFPPGSLFEQLKRRYLSGP